MQICFLIKREKEHWQIYSQAYISMVTYFGDKPTSLQRNGMAAITKNPALGKFENAGSALGVGNISNVLLLLK